MRVLKYISFKNKTGKHIYQVTLPTYIKQEDITAISPLITSSGSFYKNVTTLEDRYGNTHNVVGSYTSYEHILNPIKNKIGFK